MLRPYAYTPCAKVYDWHNNKEVHAMSVRKIMRSEILYSRRCFG